MIERDPLAASRRSYDLIVVGGGVYGITLALEAARRGLQPLLLEARDFGGATSWNSLRIVHGGLRYLQTLDLRRYRDAVAERRWFLRHFPELVEPLPCLMPLYDRGLRRPSVFRWALRADNFLSRRWDGGERNEARLPEGRVLSLAEAVRWFPTVEREGLSGGALWYDATMRDSQRLLIEMLRWAVSCGAVALNYVAAEDLLSRAGRVAGVSAVDQESGTAVDFRAPLVVNCAGPWCRQLAAEWDRDEPALFRASLAFNVLLDRRPLSPAALAVTPDRSGGRTYFLQPWQGRYLAGTCHGPCGTGEPPAGVNEALVAELLSDLSAAVPSLELERTAILRLFWGFLPAQSEGTERLAVREVIRDHRAFGGPDGLFTVSGVKFTTARRVAERTLVRVLARGGRSLPAPGPHPRPAPRRRLEASDFETLCARNRREAEALVRRLAAEEAVISLEDLLLRRTDWGMVPAVGDRLAPRIASLLGWDRARTQRELLAGRRSGLR